MEKSFIISSAYFNPKDTLTCGQVFRYATNDEGNFYVFSKDKYATIIKDGEDYKIVTDDVAYFENYFDVATDYSKIIKAVDINQTMSKVIEFGKGIRILHQDLFEMIISFIISANNNIKRIQHIIEKLCVELGAKKQFGYAFPTLESMSQANVEFYRAIGCGYRAEYLVKTTKLLHDFDLAQLGNLSTDDCRKKLLTLQGVGNKVADCILLFGLGKGNVFPTDTWIKKVYHLYFEQGHKDCDIASYMVSLFGQYSGYAQQYLFNYLRQV